MKSIVLPALIGLLVASSFVAGQSARKHWNNYHSNIQRDIDHSSITFTFNPATRSMEPRVIFVSEGE